MADDLEIIAVAPSSGPLSGAIGNLGIELYAFDSRGTQATQSERRTRLSEAVQRYRPALVHANSVSMGRLAGPRLPRAWSAEYWSFARHDEIRQHSAA